MWWNWIWWTFVAFFYAGLYYYWYRPRTIDFPTFMQMLADPNEVYDVAFNVTIRDMERDIDARELAGQPPERLVAALKDDPSPRGLPARSLEHAGTAAVPAMLAALHDPEFRRPRPARDLFGACQTEPLETLLECLVAHASPEVAVAVAPLASVPNATARNRVARILGKVASDAVLEPLCQLVVDEDHHVRKYATKGITSAFSEGRVSGQFHQTIFATLMQAGLTTEWHSECVECLLKLDRERAVAVLTEPALLCDLMAGAADVLIALHREKVLMAAEPLLNVLDKLADDDSWRSVRAQCEALQLLGLVDAESARAAITAARQHANPEIRRYATEAWALSLGMPEPRWEIESKYDVLGWEGLTLPERHVQAIGMLDVQVNNGGFLQYFFNSMGDDWPKALAGLKAVGLTQDVAWMEEVLGAFRKPLSTDRRKRLKQLAAFGKQLGGLDDDNDPFAEIGHAFFDQSDARSAALVEYIVKHREWYQPLPASETAAVRWWAN